MGLDEEKYERMISEATALNENKDLAENEEFLNGFLKDCWEIFQEEMDSRNNDDYEVNPDQMQHLVEAYRFFIKKAHDHNGKIDPFEYNPKELVGHLDTHFYFFELSGDDLLEFAKIIANASVITIDATLDGVTHISMNFPDVYRKKNK